MAKRYVEVSRKALLDALFACGFREHLGQGGGELVYSRQHGLDPTMWVKVFTSLPRAAGDARACGEDAIRVLLVFENPVSKASGCLYKASRVYRTGSEQAVIERTLERARECYKAANERHKANQERRRAQREGR
jgi:hypothetical protein